MPKEFGRVFVYAGGWSNMSVQPVDYCNDITRHRSLVGSFLSDLLQNNVKYVVWCGLLGFCGDRLTFTKESRGLFVIPLDNKNR